jgi:hypothetical protein
VRPGSGVVADDVAEVFQGQAVGLGDVACRLGASVQDVVQRCRIGAVRVDAGPGRDADPVSWWLPLQRLVGDAGLGEQPAGVLGEGVGRCGGQGEDEVVVGDPGSG